MSLIPYITGITPTLFYILLFRSLRSPPLFAIVTYKKFSRNFSIYSPNLFYISRLQKNLVQKFLSKTPSSL